MTDIITIKGVKFYITRKNIKNAYLRMKPADPSVYVSAPFSMAEKKLQQFMIKNITLIQKKIAAMDCHVTTSRLDEEGFPTIKKWMGKAYNVHINYEGNSSRLQVFSELTIIRFIVPPKTTVHGIQAIWDDFCKYSVRKVVEKILPHWERKIAVKTKKVGYRKMTSRWGSCNPYRQHISMNTELASYSTECIEYVLVHELVHLLEASHNANFYRLMDYYLPGWQKWKKLLK